jgi:putative DNA primase/helicase
VESSPGHYHAYWCVSKGFPLDKFEDVQRAIAKRFDGDAAVALLTHVARLPGFDHCKGERFRTRIIEETDAPTYTTKEIIAEFPPEKKPHAPPRSIAGRPVLPTDNPLVVVEAFVKAKFQTATGDRTLHYYRGGYYRWCGTHYEQVEAKENRSLLYHFLKDALTFGANGLPKPFKPDPTKIYKIMDALEGAIYLPGKAQAPFWCPMVANRPCREASRGLIPCKNGVLDVETRELREHNPYFFNLNCLPFDYDPDAPKPVRWMKFVHELWPEDKQARETLQETFGLFLTPDTRHQKIVLVVGPKRSGKGTTGRVLTAMLGGDNVANPTLASLNTNFGLWPLIDKSVAIISDARLGKDTNTVAERLLSISGEDRLTIDRKYQEPWNGRLGVRFLIQSNELPRIADASGALASRFVVLMLDKTFYGKEDLTLTDKLIEELPGILNWALAGMDRLRSRGHFEMPKSSLDAIRQLEELASPVQAFIRDWCEVGKDKEINTRVLYQAYALWCEQGGHQKGSNIVFGRNLRAVLPQASTHGHGQSRHFVGLALNRYGRRQYDRSLDKGNR